MHLAETKQQPEESFLHGISDLYYSIKPNNSFAKGIFDVLENCGHQVFDVAVKYGPTCVDVLSKSTAKLCEFSIPPYDKLPLVLQNFIKSSDEILYLCGRGFFKSDFGRFTLKSLDRFTYSCERLLKRLASVTKDTVIMLHSETNSSKPQDPMKQSLNDPMITSSPSLDGKPTEIVQPAPKIEPSTTDNILHSTEAESSAVDTESEQELAGIKDLSIPTTVYENVTGLEKAFVMLYDALVLCPVNATVAFIRFVRNVVRDLEEFCYSSKDNVTSAGRHVKSSSFNMAALKDRLKMLYSDIVDPMKPSQSVLRLESKKSALSIGSKAPLSSLMDTVNFYWEESDPDYVPTEASSDSCTESGDSESDISVEKIDGLLCIKVEKAVKMESEQEFKPKDKEV